MIIFQGILRHIRQNQKQTYSSSALEEKVEAARERRSKEMESLNTKIDELRQRVKDVKSAGSLQEAQLRANQAQEQLELRHKQEATAREEAWKQKEYELKQKDAETRNLNAQAAMTRATNPRSTAKPKFVPVMDNDGTMAQIDASSYKDFEGDYQRAFARAVAEIDANPAKAAEYGLTEEEIKKYKNDSRSADRIKEYFRAHTPRKAIVETMGAKGELSKYNKK